MVIISYIKSRIIQVIIVDDKDDHLGLSQTIEGVSSYFRLEYETYAPGFDRHRIIT